MSTALPAPEHAAPDGPGEPRPTRTTDTRSWLLLGGAIASEVTASLTLKAALHRPALYGVVVVGYLAAFAFLALVLRRGMALGLAYGIWGALGVAGTAVLSAIIYHESFTVVTAMGIVLIMLGVLVVEVGAQQAHATPASEEAA